MNEISHKQARFLIRLAMDGELPEEQWDMLQAHLEKCEECSFYRDQCYKLEKSLRRVLISRWRNVNGPMPGLGDGILAWRDTRKLRLQHLMYSGFGILISLVIIYLVLTAQTHKPLPPALTPKSTPTEHFQGVVTFSVYKNGRNQIFLLNSGTGSQFGDQTTLTPDTSDNIYPTWSPDGYWIAFLSNRSGSWQLYVMNVAGTHLTQLTDDPSIEWHGPLSWSYDGKWIALTGKRLQQGNTTWIYLVQSSGPKGRREDFPGPRALAQTRGTTGQARFSPYRPWLAVQLANGGIQIYSLEDNTAGEITESERQTQNMQPAPGGDFDWSSDTFSLVYLSQGPYNRTQPDLAQPDAKTEIATTLPIQPYANLQGLSRRRSVIYSLPGVNTLHSVSYAPSQPSGEFIASLRDISGTGCWNVFLVNLVLKKSSPLLLLDLCIVSPLEHANWSSDGNWLVVVARQRNPTTSVPVGETAIYAIRIPNATDQYLVLQYEAMKNIPSGVVSVAVRPSGNSLDIQPTAVSPEPPSSAPTPPTNLPGQVVYSVSVPVQGFAGSNSSIYKVNPDGTGRQLLINHATSNLCPTWSPDRTKIAFLSDRDILDRGTLSDQNPDENGLMPNQVYVMDADGGNLTRLNPGEPEPPLLNINSVYDCPVWSPDGTMLSMVDHAGSSYFLNFFMPSGINLRSFDITHTPLTADPIWKPNSWTVFLAEPASTNKPPVIAEFAYDSQSGLNPVLETDIGWDDVQAMSFSPNGQQLALLIVKYNSSLRTGNASLVVYHWPSLEKEAYVGLPNYDTSELTVFPGRIQWINDGEIVISTQSGLTSRYKSSLLRFNLMDNKLSSLVQIEDTLYGWAIHNNWLIFSTESGLWSMPIPDQNSQQGKPLQLDNEIVSSLDW